MRKPIYSSRNFRNDTGEFQWSKMGSTWQPSHLSDDLKTAQAALSKPQLEPIRRVLSGK